MIACKDCWFKLNLQPTNKQQRQLFYESRDKDVGSMSFFFIISEGGFFVLAFFELVQQLSWTALLQFLPYTFEFGLAIAIWFLKDRFRRRISYFYLAALIF